MRHPTPAAVLAGLATVCTVNAHFVLFNPVSLGYDDEHEDQGPCGTFDPTDRSTGVTDWPIGGNFINVLSTHTSVTWEFNAALISDVTNFVPLTPTLKQTGVGFFCEPQIPGNPDWVGQDAVLQVVQRGPDGVLYQVRTVPGPQSLFHAQEPVLDIPITNTARNLVCRHQVYCWRAVYSRARRLRQRHRHRSELGQPAASS